MLLGYVPIMEFCNKISKRRCTCRGVQWAPVLSRVSYRQPASRPHACQHRLHWRTRPFPLPVVVVVASPCSSSSPQCRHNDAEVEHIRVRLKRHAGRGVPLRNQSSALSTSTATACDSRVPANPSPVGVQMHCPRAPSLPVTHAYLLIHCRWSGRNPSTTMVAEASDREGWEMTAKVMTQSKGGRD
jgi:hypothetical protein